MTVLAQNQSTPVTGDLKSYNYLSPPNWYKTENKDYVMLSQSPNVREGCTLTILAPLPSSGSLEVDAKSIFDQMYPGWKFRYTGEKQYDISKGYTPQGLEYFMMEAPMHKMRPDGYYYDYEDGAVVAIGFGKQVAVIAGRHNRLLACTCNQDYEKWRRFFNTFNVKNQLPAKGSQEDASKRILGSWMAMGSGALTEYVFAANGNYQFIGAYGSSSGTRRDYDEIITIKSSAWQGDGSYAFSANQLLFKRRGDANTEKVPFRFEKVNHGGAGWKDRLYMLKINSGDGKKYEVCYEKGK